MDFPWGLILAAANSLGVAGIVIWFLRDRRRDQVRARVAERTEDAQVDLTSISAVEAHLALVNKAFDAERASLLRRIADLDARLEASDKREQELQRKVSQLQDRVDELKQELDDVARELRNNNKDGKPI